MSGFAIRHLNKEESHWYTTNFNNFQNRIGGLGGTVQIDQECNCDDARLFFAYILENVLTIYLNHILNKYLFSLVFQSDHKHKTRSRGTSNIATKTPR